MTLVDHALLRAPPPGASPPTAVRRLARSDWARVTDLASDDPRGIATLLAAAAGLVVARRTGEPAARIAVPAFDDRARAVAVDVRAPRDGTIRSYLRDVREALRAARDEAGETAGADLAVAYGTTAPHPSDAVMAHAVPDDDGARVHVTGLPHAHRRGYVDDLAGELLAALVALLHLDAPVAAVATVAALAQPRGESGPPPSSSIVDELRRQGRDTPAATAVACGGATLSYEPLVARAEAVAGSLADRHGVRPGDRVAVLARAPSERWLLAVLGVLFAGAAYVPLDPLEPGARLRRMIASARACLVLAEMPCTVEPGIPVVDIAEAAGAAAGQRAAVCVAARDLAYVMFTSGSTGRPKPVPIEHRSVVRVARGLDDVPVGPGDRVAQLSTAVFDASVFEVFGALLNGARLEIAPAEARGRVDHVARFLRDAEIDVAFLTTAVFNRVVDLDPAALAGLRRLVFGGEDPSVEHVSRALRGGLAGRLVHAYGPTETTVFATTAILDDVDPRDAFVTVGAPIGWTSVRVLDGERRPVAPGVAGEIWIGGCGVSPGRDERFVDDPFARGERLYRTGDLGCVLPGGDLRCIGRRDDQVKIRGFRIEPGEIVAALRELPGVRDAAVLARILPSGERTLDAYVVASGSDEPALRAGLAERLPAWMLPAGLELVDAIALTAHGKVDRRALTAPAAAASDTEPGRGLQERLGEIWMALIGCDMPGPDDDFFARGGHSLTATRLVTEIYARLGVELRLASVFEHSTLAGQAALVAAARRQAGAGEGPAPDGRTARATGTQRRIWFDDSARPGGDPAYLVPETYELEGPLDPELLAAALRHLVARHEALRLTFVEAGGELHAVPGDAGFEVRRARVPPGLSLDDETRRLRWLDTARAMDLRRGPLIRATLLTEHDTRHRLLLTFHHLAVDGWSLGVLLDELVALLRAGREPFAGVLPPVLPYAEAMALGASAEPPRDAVRAWLDKLADAARLELPTDRPRRPHSSAAGRAIAGTLGVERSAGVHRIASECASTPFVVLLAALQVVLSRHADTRDVTIGTPLSGRGRAGLSRVVASLIGSVALRDVVDGARSFREHVRAVARTAAEAERHGAAAFEEAVRQAGLRGDGSRHALFDVMVTMSDRALTGLEVGESLAVTPELTIRKLETSHGARQMDVTWWFRDASDIRYDVQYDPALFDEQRIERVTAHLRRLLDVAIAAPDAALDTLSMLPDDERDAIRAFGRGPLRPAPRALPDLVARAIAEHGERLAVTAPDGTLSYAQLDLRAAAVAAALAEQGVAPGDLVALVARTSLDVVAGILGAWRAGVAFVPLDPAWPAARTRAIVERAGCEVVIGPPIAGGEDLVTLAAGSAASTASARAAETPPGAAAYVMHTSGTSGHPKGVVVPHRAIATWVADQARELRMAPADVVGQPFGWTFDTSLFLTGIALVTGARLVLLKPAAPADPDAFGAALRTHGVTVLAALPSHVERLSAPDLAGVRAIVTGGESPDPGLVARLGGDGIVYLNQYGATETTCVTSWRAGTGARRGYAPAAGRPLPGVTVEILDARRLHVPAGVPGEIVAGGDCLASGYLDARDEDGAFVTGADGARRFRTGDRGRWGPDGLLEVLGRDDDRVKIRGYRVELAEVDHALAATAGVERAAAVRCDDALVGFVQAADDVDPEAALEACRHVLPRHAVPARVERVTRLPLNAGGKVDREALRRLAHERPAARAEPRNALEARLCDVASQHLGTPIGPLDDLFAMGATSLTFVSLQAALAAALHVPVKLHELFEHPVVRDLVAAVGDREPAPALSPIRAAGDRERAPASHAQQRFWLVERVDRGGWVFNSCCVLDLGTADPAHVREALGVVVARHATLRTTIQTSAGRPWQVVGAPGDVELPVVDVDAPPGDSDATRELLRRAERTRFALAARPAWDARLLRDGTGEQWLLLVLNHVVADGWSAGVLSDELAAAMRAIAAGQEPAFAPLELQYLDYAAWEQELVGGREGREMGEYWRSTLADPPPLLELGRPGPAGPRSAEGAVLTRILPADATDAVDGLARSHGASLFMTVMAAVAALANRSAGAEDFVLGFPHSGRHVPELENVVGPLVNPLPLRCRVDPRASFSTLLLDTRTACLDAYAHAAYPFDRIVRHARTRVAGRNPLFEVGVTWAGIGTGARPGPARLAPFSSIAKHDVWVHASRGDALRLDVEYRVERFDAAAIAAFADRLERILLRAADDPQLPVEDLDRPVRRARTGSAS